MAQRGLDVLAGAEGILLIIGAGAAIEKPVGVTDLDRVGDRRPDHGVVAKRLIGPLRRDGERLLPRALPPPLDSDLPGHLVGGAGAATFAVGAASIIHRVGIGD